MTINKEGQRDIEKAINIICIPGSDRFGTYDLIAEIRKSYKKGKYGVHTGDY